MKEVGPQAKGSSPVKARSLSLSRLGEAPIQAGMLFSAQLGSMAAGFLGTAIQVRFMEPGERGKFVFCLSLILIAGLFFEFGIFSAGGRVLALAKNRETERREMGALVLMATALGAAFSLFLAAVAAPIDLIFKQNVQWLLIQAALFAFAVPFQFLVEQSCIGLNQIRRLSQFQLLMAGTQLLAFLALAATHRMTASMVLIAYISGIALASLWTLVRMRPSFEEALSYARITLRDVRGYGFNVYLARLSGTASSRVDGLIITYFLGSAPLGLYDAVQRFSSPIANLSRALATTRFRAFSRLSRVSQRLAKWNTAVVLIMAVTLAAAGPVALGGLFPKYSAAAPLLVPFAALNLFAGLFQPYNLFLASHGRGAELRNIAAAVTLASFVALLVFTPRFGLTGAAWTGAGAMALDYLLHLYYYQRFRHTVETALGSEPPPAGMQEESNAKI